MVMSPYAVRQLDLGQGLFIQEMKNGRGYSFVRHPSRIYFRDSADLSFKLLFVDVPVPDSDIVLDMCLLTEELNAITFTYDQYHDACKFMDEVK